MYGLMKVASSDYKYPDDDPQWRALREESDIKFQALLNANDQLDPELVRKENRASERGFLGGALLGAAAPLASGAIKGNLASREHGYGKGKTLFRTVGGSALKLPYAPFTGMLGGILGAAATSPIAEHYKKQQDPDVVEGINNARKEYVAADSRLMDYEDQNGFYRE